MVFIWDTIIIQLAQNYRFYFDFVDKALDIYTAYYKVVLVGDFHVEETEPWVESFLLEHDQGTM